MGSGTLGAVQLDGGPAYVFVVWHPASAAAERLAHALFTSLYSDPDRPARRGLGIRVRYRTASSSSQVPQPIPDELIGCSVVVILMDANLVVDRAWCDYAASLTERAPADLVIPVALTPVDHIPVVLRSLRTLDLTGVDEDDRSTVLLNRVMHDMSLRLDVSTRPVRVFMSHAKSDGLAITRQIRRYFHEVVGLDDFFDAADVPFGAHIADEITNAAGTAVAFLAIQTDGYATREWCRLEVLEAKRQGVPIVVLAAVRNGEHRAFPYLGNAPVVRWHGKSSLPVVVSVLLREVLRTRYFPKSVESLCEICGLDPAAQVSPSPPELLSALVHCQSASEAGRPVGYLLYPDPPLGTEELTLIRLVNPDLKPVTPLLLRGLMLRGSS
jgi:TIR domain-containing protein